MLCAGFLTILLHCLLLKFGNVVFVACNASKPDSEIGKVNHTILKIGKAARNGNMLFICLEWMWWKDRVKCKIFLEDTDNWTSCRGWRKNAGWGCLHIFLSIHWMRKYIDRHGQTSANSQTDHKLGDES